MQKTNDHSGEIARAVRTSLQQVIIATVLLIVLLLLVAPPSRSDMPWPVNADEISATAKAARVAASD